MEKASEERARSSLTQMKPAHDCVHLNFDEFILPREKSRKQVDYLKARVCEWGEACLPFLIGGADGPSPWTAVLMYPTLSTALSFLPMLSEANMSHAYDLRQLEINDAPIFTCN